MRTIDKPIRLIELFAGYGSQALALKYLGANFEHWKICEWAVKSIQAYKDLHFGDDNTDYSATKTQDEVIDYLYNKGISANYNEPMTIDQIKRLGEEKQRVIYNNLIATHNLVSVCNCHASDLEISDTDKYTYIMTYSFPCQDLSLAGKGLGMEKGAFMLADELQLPVVPITINGSFNIMPRTRDWHFANWHPLSLTIHQPIYPVDKGPRNIQAIMHQSYDSVMSSLVPEYQGYVENPDQ